MELEQLPQGNALDTSKAPCMLIMEKLLSLLRAKAPNQTPRVLRRTFYVNR